MLESFVLYTEKYAGHQDAGQYQITRLDGTPAVAWHYTPIHLWREPAESLLSVDRRGIIPLMGLMQIQQPRETLPQMVARIASEPDESKRRILFTSLLALMDDEEHLAMLDKLIDSDEFLDTPFLQRIRQEAMLEGLEKGQKGQTEISRKYVLKVIVERFNPPTQLYLEIEHQLGLVDDSEQLEELFTAALRAKDIDEFTAILTNSLAE